ncbi:D-arabinitol 4-dehydrogenase [Caldimonas brevitalea]|nr:D-arabinitol 4-dehydrogenase [Caldimonas brevitalea]
MLHLGLGAFHRAHQADYLQDLADAGDRQWMLAGGNLRADPTATLEALRQQGGRYTLETVTPDGERRYRQLDVIRQVLPYEPSLAGLITLGAQLRTRIVSFTVTEAGYYLDPAGGLDEQAPELASDLQGLTRCTIYGAAAAVLQERMRRGSGPVTLLNCDNLRHNGDRFRAGLMAFLERRGQHALRDWAEANVCTPNSMVDRITPRPGPEVRERVRAATGVDDAAAVMAEDFRQWVIEDRFCHGRPGWKWVGVEMVDSVRPYEEAKIRILNATHSCIAWAGTLLGYRYIHEGTRDPRVRQLAHAYVTEDVLPCLDRPGRRSPLDLAAYRDTVLDRFGNAALCDTHQRVAMDGYSKIPGFIAPTLRERLAAGQPAHAVARLPALFLAFLQLWHRGMLPWDYQDQAMDPAAAHAVCSSADPVAALCGDRQLWGDLAGQPALVDALRQGLRDISFMTGALLD